MNREQKKAEFEAVIGLEVHAQLKTRSKIFCHCASDFETPVNENTCPICTGMPGTLPVLNREVMKGALKTALALNCTVQRLCRFARKNYFYPDLPKGYQISQYDEPLALSGYLLIETKEGEKKIRIHRLHMEEDAGKTIHAESGSLVNFNRAAIPLIEIVSEPDIHTPEEASAYLRKLRGILRYLQVSDADMEKGNFRCDANVSVRRYGEEKLGVKAEVKNMNSFKHVEKALIYEINRQVEALRRGERIVQETRLWHEREGKTYSMRSKEEAHDYRYFPDPDLQPFEIDESLIEEIRASLPELPDAKRARFMKQYEIPEYDAAILTEDNELTVFFEKVVSLFSKPKMVSNWILTELLREMKEMAITVPPIKAENFAELLQLIDSGKISGKMAKEIFPKILSTGESPMKLVAQQGLNQLNSKEEIEKIAKEIIAAYPEQKVAYDAGKKKLFGFFVGEVMKKTAGRANPQLLNQVLKELLGE